MLPRYANRTINLLKLDCDGCEFDGLLPWLASTCTEQIVVEVHGCLPMHAPPATRLLRMHKLLSALEPEYAIFASEPNLLAPGGGTCVEYGLMRRTSCFTAPDVVKMMRSKSPFPVAMRSPCGWKSRWTHWTQLRTPLTKPQCSISRSTVPDAVRVMRTFPP